MKNYLREYRNKYRLTQKKLGNTVGVRRTTISSIEMGERIPSLKLACLLARVLGTDVETLFPVDISQVQSAPRVKTVKHILKILGNRIHKKDRVVEISKPGI